MDDRDRHAWSRARLTAWRAGLLSDDDADALERHLLGCTGCREVADAFAPEERRESHAHVPASVIADWERARRSLRGLERSLVRAHLQRCEACQQDLTALGHAPRLEWVASLERGESFAEPERRAPAESSGATEVVRIVRFEVTPDRRNMRQRALLAWALVASAAAAFALVFDVRGTLVPGASAPIYVPNPPIWARTAMTQGPLAGMSVRIAPRPRSLSGPGRGDDDGRLNVISVTGPLQSLALGVKPLNVPDTSLVTVSLLGATGDTLFAMQCRQWEFSPKRMVVLDRANAPLALGEYALVLRSFVAAGGILEPRTSRYRFELRSP